MSDQTLDQLAEQAAKQLVAGNELWRMPRAVKCVRDALAAATQALREQVYVPGDWFCPTCAFSLSKRRLRASDGAVGVNDGEVTEPCPNGCPTPMERATWKQEAEYLGKRAEDEMRRANAAEQHLAQVTQERDKARAVGGVTTCAKS